MSAQPARHVLVAAAGVSLLTTALLLSSGAPSGRATASRPAPAVPAAAAAGAPAPGAVPRLAASTYLGHREWDEATDVEVDPAGGIYVTGFTLSPGFPTLAGAQEGFRGLADAFVTRLAPDARTVVWSTFLGGHDLDLGSSLALDEAGNVYVTGRTASADFPTTDGAAQPAIRSEGCQGEPCHDAFVTKLSPTGQVLYSTYLGGSANEEAIGIAVDAGGRAWVTGNTDSPDFPTRGPVQGRFQSPPCPGDLPCPYDVFVAALSPDGGNLETGTYLGGAATDTAAGLALDGRGAAYVTGATRSPDFPVTAGALQPRISGAACGPPPGGPCLDAFVSKITVDGGDGAARLAYSTYLGGTNDERAGGVAVDDLGRAVITGSTQSADLPLHRPLQPGIDNASCTAEQPEEQCDDGFVSQLDAAGAALVYSTYLGGQAEDQGLGIGVDRNGDAVVVGRTDSRDFPVAAAVQPRFGGYIDGFATRIAAGTGELVWSTFLGGGDADRVLGVDLSADGGVHLTGRTLSPDFPTRGALQPELHAEDYDAFVTVLRPS